MLIRAVATVLLAFAAAAAPAAAEETAPQKLFRERLLNDRAVSKDVKRTLRHGGFVDRNIRFADLTGDTRDDAVLTVNQGGSAGRIALFIYSSHGRRQGQGGAGASLRIIYKHQTLYRARASVKAMSTARPNGAVTFRVPVYDPGDILADPGAWRHVELRWRSRRSRFGREETRVIDNVRSRFCAESGDYCTETMKDERGRTLLELRARSFEGRYTVCVTAPGVGAPDCRQFTLRRNGDIFFSRVSWSANVPNEGRGRYSVTWRLGNQRLGPKLGFRRST